MEVFVFELSHYDWNRQLFNDFSLANVHFIHFCLILAVIVKQHSIFSKLPI